MKVAIRQLKKSQCRKDMVMLFTEVKCYSNKMDSRCDPDDEVEEQDCAPDYCIPDAYGLCNPDMDEDGGCDPHYDNW